MCDPIEPDAQTTTLVDNLRNTVGDLEEEVGDLEEEVCDLRAEGRWQRRQSDRLEALRQRQQDAVIARNEQIATLRSAIGRYERKNIELLTELGALRSSYYYSLDVAKRRSEKIFCLQEQLTDMACLGHYSQGEKTSPKKVVYGGVLATVAEAEMDDFDRAQVYERHYKTNADLCSGGVHFRDAGGWPVVEPESLRSLSDDAARTIQKFWRSVPVTPSPSLSLLSFSLCLFH